MAPQTGQSRNRENFMKEAHSCAHAATVGVTPRDDMDWMEFTCTQSMHTLDDEQIGTLASVAMEDFGPGLTRTEFNDVMLWLFESIAGFETLLWSKYQQAIRDNPLH
jgi:hypothetical protein